MTAPPANNTNWQVPAYRTHEIRPRQTRYCVGIPVINEGDRLRNQLKRMESVAPQADIILADGGSRDGTNDPEQMRSYPIRTILVKTGPGKLSAQMRMVFAYALEQGYEGIILIDGNGKDGVEAIPAFVKALEEGYDMLQGSRYIPGGYEQNTPLDRKIGVKFLHAPLISFAAGFRYTDTTNGFRGYSRRFLLDDRVQPFRNIFNTYNLHYYLSVRAPQLGYKTAEIPVHRVYPNHGPTPTKIGGWQGKAEIIRLLLEAVTGRYNPPPARG